LKGLSNQCKLIETSSTIVEVRAKLKVEGAGRSEKFKIS
jgi:hypothetical protein